MLSKELGSRVEYLDFEAGTDPFFKKSARQSILIGILDIQHALCAMDDFASLGALAKDVWYIQMQACNPNLFESVSWSSPLCINPSPIGAFIRRKGNKHSWVCRCVSECACVRARSYCACVSELHEELILNSLSWYITFKAIWNHFIQKTWQRNKHSFS